MCLQVLLQYEKIVLATLQENLLWRNQSITQLVSAQSIPFATKNWVVAGRCLWQKPANQSTQKSEGKLHLEYYG